MLSLFAGVSGAFAYEAGDYVYTLNGRFQVAGENLVTNGDFSDGTSGWTNTAGGTLSTDTFTIDQGLGPDGGNALYVAASGAVDAGVLGAGSANLMRSIAVEPGLYVISYKVKGGSETATTSNSGGNSVRCANFQSVYYSPTTVQSVIGTKSENQISKYVTYRAEDGWYEIAYNFTVGEAGFINFLLFNLNVGDSFADFTVMKATQVLDDREVTDLYNEWKAYVDAAGANAKDESGFLSEIWPLVEAAGTGTGDETVIGPGDDAMFNINDPNAVSGFLKDEYVAQALNQFLLDNSVDVASFMRNFTFDAGSYSGWTVTGSDWKVADANGNFTTRWVQHDRPSNITLGEGQFEQSYNLPAGKYLYMVQAQAHKYFMNGSGTSGDNSQTIPDYYGQIEGLRMFMADQTLELTDVPAWKGKKYSIIADLPAGEKKFGFYDCGGGGDKIGGHRRFDNICLRIFGADSVAVITYVYNNVAREALKVMRDSAQKVHDMPTYPFEKAVLKDSIAKSDAVLNLTIEKATRADIARAQQQMDWMRAAIQAYYTINAEYTALGDQIATANEAYADEERTEGKAALQSAINVAQNYYNEIQQTQVRDSATIANHTETLNQAVADYYAANAGYNFPGDIAIVNPTFADKGNGWEVTSSSESKEAWKYGADENFTGGHKIYANRGETTSPDNAVFQTVKLNYNGMYEFEFQAYANGQGKHEGTGLQDTTNVYFVTEVNGVKDSLMIHTASGDAGWFTPFTFKKRVFITNAPVDITFGIDALNNVPDYGNMGSECVATNYAYGSNKLTFYGDYDKYLKDSIAAVMLPTRDSLQRAIDAANALLGEARNPNNVSTTPFSTAINTAQGVCSDPDASLDELNAQFPALVEATNAFMVSGVWPAAGKYYDLTGLIKNADFVDENANFVEWTTTGAVANFVPTSTGYVCYYQNAEDVMTSTSFTQTVTGLPKGKYEFLMYGTYRYENPKEEVWNPEDYGENTFMYISANGGVDYVDGMLQEGALDEATNNWVLGVNRIITLYDYRHTPYAEDYFDSGFYRASVPFDVTDGNATVGMTIEGLPITSMIFFKGPQLLFWGDTVVDGINGVQDGNSADQPGDIYTISGVKVRANATSFEGLGKGIYIKNGKKYVVK
mgnify:CR=1 FL=1